MSNTRHAQPGGAFRQERYCSSSEFERGLMANLVAKRCSVLDDPKQREIVWFLQLLSWQEGGLERVAREVMARYPQQIATAAMQRLGTKAGQIYNAEQVKTARAEFPRGELEDDFLLRGEESWMAALGNNDADDEARENREASKRPQCYPAQAFVTRCRAAACEKLADHLREICLNPQKSPLCGPWYFPNLFATLCEYQCAVATETAAGTVTTSIGAKVYEALEYARFARRLVIINGLERMGKTVATKTWCAMNPGRARYVQCPSCKDEGGFFRALGEALGVSINLKSKTVEIRDRVEDALQSGDLLLVLDEAHYLWPQNSDARSKFPVRINWLMTALVNKGVAVALVTTPQFARSQRTVEELTWWRSGQFVGRIGHCEPLPDSLTHEDLSNVARFLVPEADAKSIEGLVSYAQGSAKYLAGIDAVVCRARYLASKENRQTISRADIKRALSESVIPSDSALAQTFAASERSRKRGGKPAATALQPHRTIEPATHRTSIPPANAAPRGVTPLAEA